MTILAKLTNLKPDKLVTLNKGSKHPYRSIVTIKYLKTDRKISIYGGGHVEFAVVDVRVRQT